MITKQLEITVNKGEQYVITVHSGTASNRVPRVPRPPFSDKDENGDFTLINRLGKTKSRLSEVHIQGILSGTASFTKEASMRMGGVQGTRDRIYALIQNLKQHRKLGLNVHGFQGPLPSVNDFLITEVDGRVVVEKKF